MTLDLDNLRKLEAAATPGPWEEAEWYGFEEGGWCAIGPHHTQRAEEDGSDEPDSESHERAKRDAALIAAMRNDLPALLADHARLTAEVADLRSYAQMVARERDKAIDMHDAARAEAARLRGLVEEACSLIYGAIGCVDPREEAEASACHEAGKRAAAIRKEAAGE